MRAIVSFSAVALAAVALAGAAIATTSLAAGPPVVVLTLKDHRFTPSVVSVPAGLKVQVVVINQDRATEEFDSHDLKVEKLITPGATARFVVGPLKAGSYSFMGEFHPATAQGRIVAVTDR